MTRWAWLVLAACSTGPAPDAGVAVSSSATQHVETPTVGGHGAAIELLAMTDDGTAAVSQDGSGGTRLWPALDGTREPIVVHLAPATEIAIARSGDGFVIASLDEGGGAEIAQIAATGAVVSHASVAPDPAIRALAIAPQGVLAVRDDQTLAIFDASGALITRIEAPSGSRIMRIAKQNDRVFVLLAYDDTTRWRSLDGTRWGYMTPDLPLEPSDPPNTFTIRDGVTLGISKASLVITDHGRASYLGYRINRVKNVHVLGDRMIVSGGDQKPLVLDAGLEVREAITLPDDPRSLFDLQPIDDRFALATHTTGGWFTISVIDRQAQNTAQALTPALPSGEIRYEPSTRLLALSDSAISYLTRWDAEHHKFDTWYRLDGPRQQVHLVDPQRTGGIVAIGLRAVANGQLEVTEYDGRDLKVGAPIQPRLSYRVDGSDYNATVDRAGHVYVIDDGALVIHEHGRELRRIDDVANGELANPWLRPHPRGTYIALVGQQRIRLYDAAGAERWQVASPLAQNVAWLGDQLVVDFMGGLGKIDPASGALIQRSCGWSFGLSALPGNDDLLGASICDAP